MGLKESLRKLQEDEKLDVRKEVKKELAKMKIEKAARNRCSLCHKEARYFIKGSAEGYCKGCAIELFGELSYLEERSSRPKKQKKQLPLEIHGNRIIASLKKDASFYKRLSKALKDVGIDKLPAGLRGTKGVKEKDSWIDIAADDVNVAVIYGAKRVILVIDCKEDDLPAIADGITRNFQE